MLPPPIREIFVPLSFPVAPPLYRWYDEEDRTPDTDEPILLGETDSDPLEAPPRCPDRKKSLQQDKAEGPTGASPRCPDRQQSLQKGKVRYPVGEPPRCPNRQQSLQPDEVSVLMEAPPRYPNRQQSLQQSEDQDPMEAPPRYPNRQQSSQQNKKAPSPMDATPRHPNRQQSLQQDEQTQATMIKLDMASLVMPPRRPRRRDSSLPDPKKNQDSFSSVTNQDVLNVALKPLRFVTKPVASTSKQDPSMPHHDDAQVVEIEQEMAVPLRQVTLEHSMARGINTPHPDTVTLLFVIRRTGCGNCREHGRQLSELVCSMDEHVHMAGVVKPEAVPNEILLEFYTDYFNFPLYQDDDWNLSTGVLGDRQLPLWKLLSMRPILGRRYRNKGIHNIPLGGDLWTQGGLLILDSRSRLRFVYYEKYGDVLDLEAIRWAILDTRHAARKVDTTPSPPSRYLPVLSDMSPTLPSRAWSSHTTSTQAMSVSENETYPTSPYSSVGTESIDLSQDGPPRYPQRRLSDGRPMQESPWAVDKSKWLNGKPGTVRTFWKRPKLPSRETLPTLPFFPHHSPKKDPKSVTEATAQANFFSAPVRPQRKASF